ncbi:hypothetical protein ACFDTO_33360 [Microbacteriaceae bacterium 4G12]
MELLLFFAIMGVFAILYVSKGKAFVFANDGIIVRTSRFSKVKFSKNEIRELYVFRGNLPKGTVVINGSWNYGNASTGLSGIDDNRVVIDTNKGKYLANVQNAEKIVKQYEEWKKTI